MIFHVLSVLSVRDFHGFPLRLPGAWRGATRQSRLEDVLGGDGWLATIGKRFFWENSGDFMVI